MVTAYHERHADVTNNIPPNGGYVRALLSGAVYGVSQPASGTLKVISLVDQTGSPLRALLSGTAYGIALEGVQPVIPFRVDGAAAVAVQPEQGLPSRHQQQDVSRPAANTPPGGGYDRALLSGTAYGVWASSGGTLNLVRFIDQTGVSFRELLAGAVYGIRLEGVAPPVSVFHVDGVSTVAFDPVQVEPPPSFRVDGAAAISFAPFVHQHLYWRLYVTATETGAYCAICELEMFDAAGTSLCTGGTASASSVGFGFPADQAFDGNFAQASNFWHSNNPTPSSGSPDWLRYQFASPVAVATVKITPRGGTGYAPKAFKVQYSDDGSTWTDAASYSFASWLDQKTRSFPVATPPAGSYTAWRINVLAAPAGATSAANIEFRETAGGPDLSVQQALSARAQSEFVPPTYAADKAFDTDVSSTFWSSSGALAWIENHLSRAAAIVQVAWKSRPDSANQNPTLFDLQASNDGGFTWTTTYTFTSPATWTVGEQRIFDAVPRLLVDGLAAIAFTPAQAATSQTATFRSDGIGSVYFDPRENRESWIRVDGSAGIEWNPLQNVPASGFRADGQGSVAWDFGNTFRVNGVGSISFSLQSGQARPRFRVDGVGNIYWSTAGGVSGECMSPGNADDEADLAIPPNFVY